jgi:hypothetical protein
MRKDNEEITYAMIITKGEPQYKEKEKDGISGCPE